MRIANVLSLLAIFAGLAAANDGAAALLDRANYPAAANIVYVTTATAKTELERAHQETALQLVIPSTSRQVNLDYCRPQRVTPTLWRLDLDGLQWTIGDWYHLVAAYPYHPAGSARSTLVRADWLLLQLTDQTESDAYLRFVFGTPKLTRDEALKILAVDFNAEHRFGLIEGRSGVSVAGVRWIENRPISRGYAWGTRDSLKIDGKSDPLERPDGGFNHDGEEWILGLPKIDPATHVRGALQVYFLANGKGQLVDRAPVDLVRDHTQFRGLAEIRNPGSCIQCHPTGLNEFGKNQLIETIESGVESYADYATYQAIEAFHFSDATKELRRNNEDFTAIVELACGCPPEEAALAYQSTIGVYDSPVDLERAAAEVYIEPAELKRALAYTSANGVSLGARLSGLAHGLTVPREAWEENYVAVRAIVEQWRASQ